MPLSVKKRATLEDLATVAEHLVGEIVDGEITTSPRPAARHASAASSLGGILFNPYRRGVGGPGGWVILDEPELHLGGDVLVPDLAGWRRERMPKIPDVAAFELAPDWVCEVLFPATAALDRAKKLPIYAREDIPHAWLIDPIARTLEGLRLTNGRWTLVSTFAGDTNARPEPFDTVDIDLGMLWAD